MSVRTMFYKLWRDEEGVIITLELVLLASILSVGVMAGLTTLRDAMLTELADLGGSLSQLDQSYTIGQTNATSATTAGTTYVDRRDFGDDGAAATNSRCLVVCNGNVTTPLAGNEAGDAI